MDKHDLKQAAQLLATAELKARLIYDREQSMEADDPRLDGVRSLRRELVRQVEQHTGEVNRIRAAIPELAGKAYWWDIPFDVTRPDPEEEGFSLPGGFYQEVRFDPQAEYSLLDGDEQYRNAGYLLALYAGVGGRSSYIPLYLSKKKFRAYYDRPLEVRPIYNVMYVDREYDVISHINTVPSPSARIWAAFQREAEEARQITRERVAEYNERQDALERRRHDSFWTDEERWMAGQMDTEDYVSASIRRTWGENEITDKARRKEADRRFLTSLKAREADRSYRASGKTTESSHLVRLMCVGEAVYHGDELLAVVAYRMESPVQEITCSPDFRVESLSGPVYGCRQMFERRPEYASLVAFLVERYGDEMPAYSPLKPRPAGCPDGLWRMWAESRWAFALQRPDGV